MTFARLGPSSRTVALLFSVPVAALAQTGRITGTVTDMGAAPLVGAQVLLATVGMAAKSGDEGKFTIRTVPVGTYDLTVIRLGFKPAAVTGVLVRDGVETTLAIHLERDAVQLAGVVTTGARRTQKVTDAPGTITVLDTSAVSGTIGNSYFPVLKEAKGIEFLQAGVTSVFINARGFNSSFNTRMLYVEDGRIAVLHTGLPLGPFTTIPKLDLASVEVLAGPGSALYGPDASNGIVLLTSKDPRQFPGWATEVSGGTRNFYSAQGRYASTRGPWSYKIAAEYQAADDWRNIVYYPAVTAGGAPVLERGTDFRTDVARGTASLAFYTRDDARVQLTVGASKRNGIGLTAPGRSQHSNIVYRDYQLEFTGSRWFAQVYHTNANAGSSYGLGNFSQNLVKLPTASFDSVKKLSVMPGDGRIYAAEVQNNFTLGMLGKTGITAIDRAHVVWGGQFRHDRVSSYQQYLSDRRTGKAIETSQRGAYAQVEMPLARMLAVVVAGRYDTHDRWSPQFSPKAGLLFAVAPNQTVRLTYNRAFKTPFIIQTDVYQQNANNSVSFGNSGGVDIKNAAGTLLRTIDPIKPETNVTWELGYKGVIGGKLAERVCGGGSVGVRSATGASARSRMY